MKLQIPEDLRERQVDQARGGSWSPRQGLASFLPSSTPKSRPLCPLSLLPGLQTSACVLGLGKVWRGWKGGESLLPSFYLNQWLPILRQGSRQAGGTRRSDLRSRVSASSAQPILGGAQGLLREVPGHGAWVSFLEGPLQGRASKSRGEGKLGLSPKEVSLVTGNEAEAICRLLSLVGPVFTGVGDSWTPQEPPLLPALLCTERPVPGEDGPGEAGRARRILQPRPLHLPAFSCMHCRGLWEKGWGASSDGAHRGQKLRAEGSRAGGGRA